jgi:hypothetical protein
MVNIFQIDKSGRDLFEKDYSIVLILNKEKVYGVNISQEIKDKLLSQFRSGKLNLDGHSEKKRKNRFRLRFHTSIVIKLLEKAMCDFKIEKNFNIQICNDFDGHFHEIKDMIFKNISKKYSSLKMEDILQVKFQKPSTIDDAGKAFRNKDKKRLSNYKSINLNEEELIRIIKR